MSSTRKFGYSVAKAGRKARMSKFDLTDAYKNIPCKKEDLRLQGFFWLGKFFIEKRIFEVEIAYKYSKETNTSAVRFFNVSL